MVSTSSSSPIHGLRPRIRGWSVISTKAGLYLHLCKGWIMYLKGEGGGFAQVGLGGGGGRGSTLVSQSPTSEKRGIRYRWYPCTTSMVRVEDPGTSGPCTSFIAALDKGQWNIAVCRRHSGYTKYRRLVNRRTIGLWRALKSLRQATIPASSQNIGGKVWRLVTIWARQNIQLLTSSWSGWRALVQILVDMLPLRHVDPKWSDSSGYSAFMGGISPVLCWLVVPARLVKICAGVQNSGGRANFHHFLWKLKNSISASKCPITAPKIHT